MLNQGHDQAAKGRIRQAPVFPAKAGIQFFQDLLDAGSGVA
jgi:hypothetical protein